MERRTKISINLNPFGSSKLGKIIYFLFCTFTAMVGYTIHHEIVYSIFNFIFAPISLVYWLITHDINWSVVKETFSFLLE